MYLSHFRLQEYPFSLTPDPAFFFETAAHRDALNVLQAALRIGEGFIKVTAEIGLGKTLLCRLLLRQLGDSFVTAYIPDPMLSPHSLRIALAGELGVSPHMFRTDERLLRGIQKTLLANATQKKRTVLLIDEAHQLTPKTLESVRLLTNLETEKSKLLQVVIFGQPELDRRLVQPGLRQLRQRISFECTLAPLTAADTSVYVAHRMTLAGAPAPVFNDAALRGIYAATRGTPRLINLVCHKSLLAAFGGGGKIVLPKHVKRAVADSKLALGNRPHARSRWWPTGFGLPTPRLPGTFAESAR